MSVAAVTPDYHGEHRDKVENFHGNQIVYIGWDRHLFFCAPVALPLSPDTPFRQLIDEVIPGAFSMHPEFDQIKWDEVEWHVNGEPHVPQLDKSLIEQGIDHKSAIRMATPGLHGINGSGT